MLIQFWRDETRQWRPKGRQDEVIHGHIGLKGEQIAERWLKTRGFSIIESHTKHPHAGPYDIKAQKSGMVWPFEVKYGTKPSVAIQNLVRMYNERGLQKKYPSMHLSEAMRVVENVSWVRFGAGKLAREWTTMCTTKQEKILYAVGAPTY